MALYTISDLHLPLGIDKPMDIFGSKWENYVEKLADNWQTKIGNSDLVVLPGDFSWATYLEEAYADFDFLNRLNGTKILLKGNHDYWWATMNKLNEFVANNGFFSIKFLHNNHFMYEDTAICGTRGWKNPMWAGFDAEDKKIFDREVIRLKISLEGAKNASSKIVFTHYPPMSMTGETNAFTETLEQNEVSMCLYGHLHSHSHKNAVLGNIRGVYYNLVSGDYIDFDPLKILD